MSGSNRTVSQSVTMNTENCNPEEIFDFLELFCQFPRPLFKKIKDDNNALKMENARLKVNLSREIELRKAAVAKSALLEIRAAGDHALLAEKNEKLQELQLALDRETATKNESLVAIKVGHEAIVNELAAMKLSHEAIVQELAATKLSHEATVQELAATKLSHEATVQELAATKLNHEGSVTELAAMKLNLETTVKGFEEKVAQLEDEKIAAETEVAKLKIKSPLKIKQKKEKTDAYPYRDLNPNLRYAVPYRKVYGNKPIPRNRKICYLCCREWDSKKLADDCANRHAGRKKIHGYLEPYTHVHSKNVVKFLLRRKAKEEQGKTSPERPSCSKSLLPRSSKGKSLSAPSSSSSSSSGSDYELDLDVNGSTEVSPQSDSD